MTMPEQGKYYSVNEAYRDGFPSRYGEYIDRLRHDPEYALKVERILALLLDHPATGDYFRSLWQDLVAWLEADLASDASRIGGRIVGAAFPSAFPLGRLHAEHAEGN